MNYLSKITTTLGIAAAFGAIAATTASADSVTVNPGDTLSKIALEHNTDADTLAALNGIQNKNLIFVGDTIQLDANTAVTMPALQTQVQAPAEPVAPVVQEQAPAPVAQPAQQTPAVAPATQGVGESDALNALIARESGGNTNATNGQFYGIGQLSPQARARYGGNSSDYNDQLNAMKSYINDRYGSAENAWAHSQATGWY